MDIRSNHHLGLGGKAAGPTFDPDRASEGRQTPHTSRSFVNLTGSTLFGIYSPTGYEPNRDEPSTPFGTGALTPARNLGAESRRGAPVFTAEAFKERAAIGKERQKERKKSMHQQRQYWRRASTASHVAAAVLRAVLLFAFGIAYGEIITQLHNSGRVAPVQVNQLDQSSWSYLAFWGLTGILLGATMPYLDRAWEKSVNSVSEEEDDSFGNKRESTTAVEEEEDEGYDDRQNSLGTDWGDVVRSVGAFVGIAFAIVGTPFRRIAHSGELTCSCAQRKLSWQSTLQVSLTLALVNPVIWYLIDRTRTGFLLASIFGVVGASLLLSINPNWVPAPATASPLTRPSRWKVPSDDPQFDQLRLVGFVSYDQIGVATWISSVLFCSCIFFGNIGRHVLPDKR